MRSFRNRLLVLIIGLIAVTQTVTLFAVSASTADAVRARAGEQLRTGGPIVQQFMRFRANQLANGVAVLAADFGFREAVASRDRATILSAAENHAQRIRADLVMLIDPAGQIIATTSQVQASPNELATLIGDLAQARDRPRLMQLNSRLYQFVVAPVRAPETIAWVATGFSVDDALAREIGGLVGVDVSLIGRGTGHAAFIASSLAAPAREALAHYQTLSTTADERPQLVELAGAPYLSSMQRLDGVNGSLDVVLQMAMSEVMAPYRELRATLVAIGGTALLLAIIVSVFLGRGATRPIDQLVSAAKRIEGGDYAKRIAVGGGEEFQRLAVTLSAMQERVAAREERITHQAHHDALTGLPNRVAAERHIAQYLQEAGPEARIALIILDLKSFREVNASLGHNVGDQALREVAQRLVHNTRTGDLVARLGANQFLVAMRQCPFEYARRLATQLCSALRAPIDVDDVPLALDPVAGLCVAPDHGNDATELLRRAEIALQEAKDQRVEVATYQTGRDTEQRRKVMIVAALREALAQGALTLAYQPKVAMASHRLTSLEALARWTHPRLGVVSPAEFVPLAEQAGLSGQLSRWVLSESLRQLGAWRAAGFEIELAVNLSAPDIANTELLDGLLRDLERTRTPAGSLVLEITESAVMRDPHTAARNMERMRVVGLRFAIDDFGTGYSSLSLLQRLPVDELKIDRSFISGAHASDGDAAIVRATIELAHSLGLRVVAEGVENGDTWALLTRLGCDYAQGFFISRPLAAADVPSFIRGANERLQDASSATAQVRVLENFRSTRG
jgi:diguanylate cyclase (GGDEF)-like protein